MILQPRFETRLAFHICGSNACWVFLLPHRLSKRETQAQEKPQKTDSLGEEAQKTQGKKKGCRTCKTTAPGQTVAAAAAVAAKGAADARAALFAIGATGTRVDGEMG
jgi:hypothetical protein